MTLPNHFMTLIPSEHVAYLKKLFSQCPQVVLESISINHYKEHHNLISTYQNSTYVFILLKGRLQAIEERVVDIPYSFTELTPFDIVGDYELFTDAEGHYVTLKTMEPSICLQIPSSMYLYWIKHDVNALFMRTQMLMKELSIQTQQQRQYLFMDNRTKLLIYIQGIYKKHDTSPICIVQATREKIAGQIGCSIRTLNRIILTLSKEHLLHVIHGKLHITQEQRIQIQKEIANLDFHP